MNTGSRTAPLKFLKLFAGNSSSSKGDSETNIIEILDESQATNSKKQYIEVYNYLDFKNLVKLNAGTQTSNTVPEFDSDDFLKRLPPHVLPSKSLLPLPTHCKQRRCLVLDLDETLVH